MAAASGLSAAVSGAGAAAEPFLRGGLRRASASASCSAFAAPSPSLSGVLVSPLRRRGGVSRVCLPRCDAGSEQGSDTAVAAAAAAPSRASSVSALEQLKTSAGDRYTKERSSIAVVGLSVHTTPVEMREKLAVPEANWPRAIAELCELYHIEEAAVLSTCNRMEIYVVALSWHRGIREVIGWMSKVFPDWCYCSRPT